MNAKLFLLILLVVPLFLSGCQAPQIKSVREEETKESTVYSTNKIKIQNGLLVPDKISIKVGDEVTFTNLDDPSYVIASDPHPQHTEIPNLYSPPIYKSQTYKYKFTSEGSFGVHLEENPSIKGRIIVSLQNGETEGTNNDNK